MEPGLRGRGWRGGGAKTSKPAITSFSDHRPIRESDAALLTSPAYLIFISTTPSDQSRKKTVGRSTWGQMQRVIVWLCGGRRWDASGSYTHHWLIDAGGDHTAHQRRMLCLCTCSFIKKRSLVQCAQQHHHILCAMATRGIDNITQQHYNW